ncbi:MAG: prepilin peptidase [Rhodocyclaceae bacterium]|nr:prepilin peptidase [Rhodocyclaceae bacterium]
MRYPAGTIKALRRIVTSVDGVVVALAMATLGMALDWRYGTSLRTAGLTGFAWVLVWLAAIDRITRLLPDVLTMPLLWLGLVAQLHPATRTVGAELAIGGAVLGYLPLRALELAWFNLRGVEALGFGDLKLLAAIGAWLGPQAAMLVLVGGALGGSAWHLFMPATVRVRLAQSFPLGPWLVGATLALMLAGPEWMGWGP